MTRVLPIAPTVCILLGGTGDLAQKKLLSSLAHLYAHNLLGPRFSLLGCSRDAHTDESYRSFVREKILRVKPQYDTETLEHFLSHVTYLQGSFDDPHFYHNIQNHIEVYEKTIGLCTNKLFYLAIHPALYETVFERIAETRLEKPCEDGIGWSRILVEKPFGNDLTHAEHLEKRLSHLFREEQIYRIDHYLAKDALQSMLAFRFSNVLFENRWNRKFIERIVISAHESFGVENRGIFFNGVGALRDVGQNHLLQMLALVGMEHPKHFDAPSIRKERARVLKALVPLSEKDYKKGNLVKGQYEGFRDIPDVTNDSQTETFFALTAFIKNARWRGVPFHLSHGKAMARDSVSLAIQFRSAKNCVCGNHLPHEHGDMVIFSLSPEQKLSLRLWTRKHGTKHELEAHTLTVERTGLVRDTQEILRDAYEEVLLDALQGNQTLFVSSEEQRAQWRFITTILTLWKDKEPILYPRGSTGPDFPQKHLYDIS
jgi:glucose-6-phosphate 1-dehydrogenase